jgi:hypothetical protein
MGNLGFQALYHTFMKKGDQLRGKPIIPAAIAQKPV